MTLAARPMTGHDLITDLLSEVPLTARAPVVHFLAEMAARLPADGRARYTDVLIRMFRQGERSGDWPASAYRPTPGKNVAARFAAYTANLMLLAVVTSGDCASASWPNRPVPNRSGSGTTTRCSGTHS